jgi:hypothetical protein
MAAAGWAVATGLTLAMSRSAKGAQRAAWPAITGSTAATPDDMLAFWLRTSWTAREPTMKAPRKPAARVIGLRPAETMLWVKTQNSRVASVWKKLVLTATEWRKTCCRFNGSYDFKKS